MEKRLRCCGAALLLAVSLTGCLVNPYEDGMEALENGQFKEAAEEFQQAVEKGQSKADSYRGLGIALWESEDYEGAKAAFENAVKEGGEKTGILCHFLGSCELRSGNFKEAIAYFEEGIKDERVSDEVRQEMRFNCIAAYEKLGDMDTAKSLLTEYVKDYPEDEAAVKEAQFWETR